jgi:subtilisin family serine protease
MKETHIILRNPSIATHDVFLGANVAVAAETPAAASLKVEVEDIDRQKIPAIARNRDVVAIAPAVPMRLVAPVAIEDAPALLAAPPAVPWGIRAVGADTTPFTGQGVVVAVLDTGIDAAHPAFAGVDLLQKDFTGEGDGDTQGHGTHCAGTIFGRASAGQRIGVAQGVERALIGKVIGQNGGASDQIVKAMIWAVDNGANVISMSLGIDFPGLVQRLVDQGFPTALATSRALEGYRANVQLFAGLSSLIRAQGAFAQATVIVAAAGNESDRAQNPDFEIAVSPPAIADGIISVAAVAEGLTVAPFSNTGANVSGPGVRILSAKRGGGFTLMNGTSMATPHVAGVAALWAEKLNSLGALSPFQFTSRLLGSATTDGFPNGFDPFDIGLGMVRAPQA